VTAVEDPITLLFKLGLGPWLMPVAGKFPILDAWTTFGPVDEAMVRSWVACAYNLGLRCGAGPGVLVIDNDQPRKPDGPQDFVLPPTGFRVVSPTGSTHGYYRHAGPWPKNSSDGSFRINVDVKSEGGYVVVPPSVHPIAQKQYRWEATGEMGTVPDDILAQMFKTKPAAEVAFVPQTGTPGYASTAMAREVHRVRTAGEGSRNDTLNTAAFNLGQLVAGGSLNQDDVRSELASAAAICGLTETEAAKTISSGLKGGSASPRTAPIRTAPQRQRPTAPAAPAPQRDVLVPGSHTLPSGEYIEQGTHTFAHQTMAGIAPGQVYRRASIIGEIHEGQFVPVTVGRFQTIIDENVRLIASRATGDGDPIEMYRSCTPNNASVLLDYASVRGSVRELKHIATHPVCVGADFLPARPGWNEASGVFQTCSLQPTPLPLDEGRAVLEDQTCDFPFATKADRANFIGLMLTVLLRPAIGEPVPMHLVGASMERTGKGKLASIVLGCTMFGSPIPETQIGTREEEREKRIGAALLGGKTVLNLDNLAGYLDSAALASLLTSNVYEFRELGLSRLRQIPNGMTIIATGNNVQASSEISKRIVPITLQPQSETPHTRTDYRHPQLQEYILSQRERILGALLGFVASWRDAGRPMGRVVLGGFERHGAVVGGIMAHAGYPEWCSNLSSWGGTSDDFGAELRTLVGLWHDQYGCEWTPTSSLFTLAQAHELFERATARESEQGKKTAFGQRVISAIANRIVGEWKIEVEGNGKRRQARLVQK
jgi:hypothetical protein